MGQRRYSIEEWRAVKRALAKGATIREAARLTGVNRNAVQMWSHETRPPHESNDLSP